MSKTINLSADHVHSFDIAIIGTAGRFPGADSAEALWQLLLDGQEPFTQISPEQLAAAGHAHLARSPRYVPQARIPSLYDCFDAAFFGYSPREAAFMDPQQRMLLECAWHVFEDAGQAPGDTQEQRTAVFASVGVNGYAALHALPQVLTGNADMLDSIIGNDKDYCATRIAYKLNLCGAAINVQTACSSSLVAVHLAVQSLLGREVDRALVAAASLNIPAEVGYLAEESGIRSPDGHCRPFDARSNGTVFGGGVAGILLRRLDDALADGDRVLAVIRGSAVNNDGTTRVGFTAPGLQGQIEVISEALQVAQIDAADVAYVECHGTGTRLGDPIEIDALNQAMRANSAQELPHGHCLIGSLKSNIGHLDTVAGLAGLIKVARCVQSGEIPATLHFTQPNPHIGIEQTPFQVVASRQPWPPHRPRLAGLSGFGFGGTNAHLIVAGPPDSKVSGPARAWTTLPLSAMTDTALRLQAQALADWIERHPGSDLADIGHTLQVGRRALPWRAVAIARGRATAAAELRQIACKPSKAEPRPVWLFPGQGSHYAGMAAALYDSEPLFREQMDDIMAQLPTWANATAIRSQLLDLNVERCDDTAIVQPALFTYELALGRTLLAFGMTPSAMLGHSLGELSAACLAGVFDLPAAVRLVCLRGTLMAQATAGGMVLVHTEAEKILRLLDSHYPELDLAVVNSPGCCVIGGPGESLDAMMSEATRQGWQPRRLRTSHAFHTRLMEPTLAHYREAVKGMALSPPRWPLLNGQDGQWLSGDQATDPEHWVQQLRRPVRFDLALDRLSTTSDTLVEVGPPGGLLPFAREAGCHQQTLLPLGGDRIQTTTEQHFRFLSSVAQLWQTGAMIDWASFNRHWLPRRKLALPPYPFARERHWLPSSLPLLLTTGTEEVAFLPAEKNVASDSISMSESREPGQAGIQFQPRPPIDTAYCEPLPGLEQEVARIWQSLLFIISIGRHDDFFALGGNSILALRLCQQVRTLGWNLNPQQVFQARDIASLCACMEPVATTPAPDVQLGLDPKDAESLAELLGETEIP